MNNYMENLMSRGGGLLLGTDHSSEGGAEVPHHCGGSFTSGINFICDQIDITRFTGCYAQAPLAIVADLSNDLMIKPNHAPHGECNGQQFLWDDSSTSVPAAGLQVNGQFLYSVAWHGSSALNGFPAITASFRGAAGYVVEIDSPHTCGD